ncbi:CPBP family intramembrane metalloprotease [Cellulomonas fimi]|uniref:CPBP family intramembrane metalloprotease n=1 Tax=Cellulomonas fimi TaxID=1708 RepID=A0A7Y0LX93_CELFI|nr:CPBP family intramembrane metalloprotease [Cellulomonas fimi]
MTLKALPVAVVSLAGFVLFALEQRELGYALLAIAVALGLVIDRALGKDLALIGFGLAVMGAVPITTDVSNAHMVTMGTAMVLAVAVPYLVSRFVYRDHAVRFPIRTGERWTTLEKAYLVAVPLLGYLLLPTYMINTGVYRNWPAVSDAEGIGRLFLGTNALGIWDELFFICTVFTLLRRHLPFWQANVLQAVLFTSFLYELGFHSWGPVLIYAFALVQGYIFRLTRSLTYVVSVHLLFDLVLFLVLVHAHNREWLDIFLY